MAIAHDGSHIGVVNSAARKFPPDAPYFHAEFGGGADAEGLVFAAGVCSEGEGGVDIEIRRYATALLSGFFATRGRDLKTADYGNVLRRTLRHIHEHIMEKWGVRTPGLDMVVVLASASRAFAARCGKGNIYIFREDVARGAFEGEGGDALMGGGEGCEVEVEEMPLEPGSIMVICNPAVARVIGERDMTLILRRAPDPAKAGLFLSAIAERKGAEGPITALLWEVPNYRGVAMLTEEAPPAEPRVSVAEEEMEAEEGKAEPADQADQAKRQWINKWRHRKEPREPGAHEETQ